MKFSLKAKINLLIAAAYLVAALATLTVFTRVAAGIIDEFAQRIAVKQALLERNKIMAVIDRELGLAGALASDPAIRRWIEAEEDPGRMALAFDQLENYRRLFRDKSYFVALAKSGRYYVYHHLQGASRLKTYILKPEQPKDRWFFNTLDRVETSALNVDYEPAVKAAKVWFNVIIRDETGQKTGVGGGGIDISDFIREIVSNAEPGVEGMVVDKDGVIQAHKDHLLVMKNALNLDDANKTDIYSLLRDQASADRLRLALSRISAGVSEVETLALSMEGKQVLAAVSSIPDIGWRNVVLVDLSHLISERVFRPLLVLFVGSLFLVIAAISVCVNRVVVRPLLALTAAAGEVAKGRYDISLPVTRSDEIGRLTDSFNTMTAKVLDYTQNLEHKVEQRTAELTAANLELSDARRRSMESLRYARMIQQAILPKPEHLAQAFAEHTVLYLPRDIVGGDLYYLRQYPDRVLFAVLDCTGHGVPGAFMAMTMHSVLNHVTDVLCSDDPATILRETDRVLRQTLGLDDAARAGGADCGLEIALCCWRRGAGEVVFAGAGLPLFVLDKDGAREVKGNKRPLGYRGDGADRVYENRIVAAPPGATFYATTDGFLDEGGGDKGYSFGTERFKAMLLALADHPLSGQALAFDQALRLFRGRYDRRDDITVVGFRM